MESLELRLAKLEKAWALAFGNGGGEGEVYNTEAKGCTDCCGKGREGRG